MMWWRRRGFLLLFRGDREASSALKHKFWKMKDCNFSNMVPCHQFDLCNLCVLTKKNAGDERLIQTWRDMQRLAKRHRPQCLFSVMPFALDDASKLNLALYSLALGLFVVCLTKDMPLSHLLGAIKPHLHLEPQLIPSTTHPAHHRTSTQGPTYTHGLGSTGCS